MTATSLPLPDEFWSIERRVIAYQQMAYRLFDVENWVWAAKMLMRAERLARRLDPDTSPFDKAGRELIALARQLAPHPAAAPALAPKPEPPAPEPTDEQKHELFKSEFERVNSLRSRAGVPTLTWTEALDWCAAHHGQQDADAIAAIQARLEAGPSG